MFSRSVAQIATASMRTSTSAFFGTGTGLSVSASSPGSPSTHAFMVSGMGQSGLVFTPGGAYLVMILLGAGSQSLLRERARTPRINGLFSQGQNINTEGRRWQAGIRSEEHTSE